MGKRMTRRRQRTKKTVRRRLSEAVEAVDPGGTKEVA
jgi:hypothetical protein